MKTKEELSRELSRIDHKGYKAYKDLEGEYGFGSYHLCIDHVQGDPFATPSRVRLVYRNRGNIPLEWFDGPHRRVAAEDALLRRLHQSIRAESGRDRRGTGHSGDITACRPGQEILETTAMRITEQSVEARIEVGFPAYGRTIAAGELHEILFDVLPRVAERTFRMGPQLKKQLEEAAFLADDQRFIRRELERLGLAAFVADGSILPRESGVSQRRLEGAVPFESPDRLAVTLALPHRGALRGMGIRRGITAIVGGGFHGKSTLLKALERGVYNHIAGDGREYVITDASAVKLRAEEGRRVHGVDISMFIRNLPNGDDTANFFTENASGSTSQAANTVEALCAGSKLLLIDEDTSAANFMTRDDRMARLVPDDKEPITPLIRKVKSLHRDLGVSTVLVMGSSGDYLSVADTVIQMDCYRAVDVTEKAAGLAREFTGERAEAAPWLKYAPSRGHVQKAKVYGRDTVCLDKAEIDLRGLEQVVSESQMAALAYLMQYILEHWADGKRTNGELARLAWEKIDREGILSVTPRGYPAGPAAKVRLQEILGCLER